MKGYPTLLTIAIPTYNRAAFLDQSLESLKAQMGELNDQVELIISDNHSSDDTPSVVEKHRKSGLNLRYLRNEENIGMDGNFIQCFRSARSEYLWVLGDDDYLGVNALADLVSLLKEKKVGLLHLKVGTKAGSQPVEVFEDADQFLENISFYITFISSNIMSREAVEGIDPEQYRGTYISLVPAYFSAAVSGRPNVVYHKPVFTVGHDAQHNGGYNYFEVFVNNYLSVCLSYVKTGDLSPRYYRKEKRSLFHGHVLHFIERLLIRKKLGNFDAAGAWRILLRRYGWDWYFYWAVAKIPLMDGVTRVKSDIRKIVKNGIRGR